MAAVGWYNVTFDDPTIGTVSVRVTDHTHDFELRIDVGNVTGLPATPDGFRFVNHVNVTPMASGGETPDVEEMTFDLSISTPDGINASQITALELDDNATQVNVTDTNSTQDNATDPNGTLVNVTGWSPLDATGVAELNNTLLQITTDGTGPLLIAYDVAPPTVQVPEFADHAELQGAEAAVADNRGIAEVTLTVDGEVVFRTSGEGARTLLVPLDELSTATGETAIVTTDVSGLTHQTPVEPVPSPSEPGPEGPDEPGPGPESSDGLLAAKIVAVVIAAMLSVSMIASFLGYWQIPGLG